MTITEAQTRQQYDLRRDLIDSGVLAVAYDHYRFSQDYVFTSPSAAAREVPEIIGIIFTGSGIAHNVRRVVLCSIDLMT